MGNPPKAAPNSKRGKKKANKRNNRKRSKDLAPLTNGAGVSFSESPLDVDYGDTTSTGVSSQTDDVADVADLPNASVSGQEENQVPESVPAPSTQSAPIVNWNNTPARSAIRTSLRGSSKSFQNVNDTYWRAADQSSSSDNEGDTVMKDGGNNNNNTTSDDEDADTGVVEDKEHAEEGEIAEEEEEEEGEVHEDPANANSPDSAAPPPAPQEQSKPIPQNPAQEQGLYYAEESDGSYDDEPSDIILNFSGDEDQDSRLEEIQQARKSPSTDSHSSSPRSPPHQSLPSNVEIVNFAAQDMSSLAAESEARRQSALKSLQAKYPVEPTTLADLTRQDLEKQAKYLFYHLDINDIDLSLPIRCIDCFEEGHLSETCPNKTCPHCKAWQAHDSRFCPLIRRCQHCRARGHEREGCIAPRRSCHDVPCDLCGSKLHFETQCDLLWRSTTRKVAVQPPAQIKLSISCAYCAGSGHLFGDCPERERRARIAAATAESEDVDDGFTGMPWSLKDIDPATIVNLNTVPYLGGKIGVNKGNANSKSNNNNSKGGNDFRIKGKASSGAGTKRGRNDSSSLSDPEEGGVFGNGDASGGRVRSVHQLPNRPPIRFNTDIGRGRSFGGNNSNANGRGGGSGGGYRGRGGRGGSGSQRGRSNDSWRPDYRYR